MNKLVIENGTTVIFITTTIRDWKFMSEIVINPDIEITEIYDVDCRKEDVKDAMKNHLKNINERLKEVGVTQELEWKGYIEGLGIPFRVTL